MIHTMINPITIQKLKERYKHIHPLMFHRSVERAENDVELFDILDSIPQKYPIVWDESERRWVYENDLTLASRFSESILKR
jgi:hypothetical protein